jgi:hypothetical protein
VPHRRGAVSSSVVPNTVPLSAWAQPAKLTNRELDETVLADTWASATNQIRSGALRSPGGPRLWVRVPVLAGATPAVDLRGKSDVHDWIDVDTNLSGIRSAAFARFSS